MGWASDNILQLNVINQDLYKGLKAPRNTSDYKVCLQILKALAYYKTIVSFVKVQ